MQHIHLFMLRFIQQKAAYWIAHHALSYTHNAQSKGEKNENSIPHSWWVTREVWRMEKAISRKSHQPFNGTARETETTPQKRPSQTKNDVIKKIKANKKLTCSTSHWRSWEVNNVFAPSLSFVWAKQWLSRLVNSFSAPPRSVRSRFGRRASSAALNSLCVRACVFRERRARRKTTNHAYI